MKLVNLAEFALAGRWRASIAACAVLGKVNAMCSHELGSSMDKYRCLCTEKDFDKKFVWLFRYGFLFRGLRLKVRYCELITCYLELVCFFLWEANKVPTSVYLARQSCNLVI